jgi:hypothetical protein
MRAAAVEVIGVAGPEHLSLPIDSHLETSADDDSALLSIMDEQNAPRIRARCIALLENLQGAPDEVLADLAE